MYIQEVSAKLVVIKNIIMRMNLYSQSQNYTLTQPSQHTHTRPGANVLGTRVLVYSCTRVLVYSCTHVLMYSCTHVLEYIFEVLVLVKIMDHVLVLVLAVHVLLFYEYFTSTFEYSYHFWLI